MVENRKIKRKIDKSILLSEQRVHQNESSYWPDLASVQTPRGQLIPVGWVANYSTGPQARPTDAWGNFPCFTPTWLSGLGFSSPDYKLGSSLLTLDFPCASPSCMGWRSTATRQFLSPVVKYSFRFLFWYSRYNPSLTSRLIFPGH